MATHNYVRLLGILRKSPKFLKLGNSTAAMFSLIVLNKSRSEKDTFYYNVPTIFTDDEKWSPPLNSIRPTILLK